MRFTSIHEMLLLTAVLLDMGPMVISDAAFERLFPLRIMHPDRPPGAACDRLNPLGLATQRLSIAIVNRNLHGDCPAVVVHRMLYRAVEANELNLGNLRAFLDAYPDFEDADDAHTYEGPLHGFAEIG